MDLEVFDMGEIIPDFVDDIVGTLAFNRRNRRNRLEVGESDFKELGDGCVSSVCIQPGRADLGVTGERTVQFQLASSFFNCRHHYITSFGCIRQGINLNLPLVMNKVDLLEDDTLLS